MEVHEKFIAQCNKLALESYSNGDLPFGALITQNDMIIVQAHNTVLCDLTGHAEINAIKKVIREFPDVNLSECTLYSNFEPCAMCAYMIRDYDLARVVYAVASPHLGGHSRWKILTDPIRPKFTYRESSQVPEIIAGVLEKECSRIFDELGWEMHVTTPISIPKRTTTLIEKTLR